MNEEVVEDFSMIDELKAKKIMKKIIIEETNNLKTNGDNNSLIVKKIQRIIEEEVQCF